ncbi:Pickpocket protein 28 [Orchesella cincta]|uniref:Pickpocket protein 28 n=1 Tax=Orchesella cincta TaxID=48709 RepID=A0A1D2MTK5_ORCCI|nr:Pickpocket protein 28 [Orchesella cincta]
MGSIKRISVSYDGDIGDGMYRSSSLPTLHSAPIMSVTEGSVRRKYRDSVLSSKCCESTKLCWWEPDPEYPSSTVDFCLDTSLHGMKYICQPQRHLTERIFWLFGFIVAIFAAGWLISDLWIKYLSTPLVVTFQPFETTVDQIPFPAITTCNMNKVLRSKAEMYIATAQQNNTDPETLDARKNVYYLDHVCKSSQSFSKRFNFSLNHGSVDPEILKMIQIGDGDDEQRDVVTFLRKASQQCSEMLLKCMWNDEVVNCNELFKPIETDFGECCVFNMVPPTLLYRHLNDSRDDQKEIEEWSEWKAEESGFLVQGSDSEKPMRTFPRRQIKAGKTYGLSILLNPDLGEYFCTSSDSVGFRLAPHLPIDVPHVMDLGIAIKPNTEVFLGIKPEITLADPDIKDFKLEKRNCYFQGEKELAYYKYYTVSNCIEECIANITYSNCGCVRYNMPRDDTRDLCGPGKFECVEGAKKTALQAGAKSVCNYCLPPCTELEYFSEVSYTNIPRDANIWVDSDNSTAKWAKNQVSIVHIFFVQDSTYARVRKELYGWVDLIANTGGILGLCMGFSTLSVIELIYFYSFRAWCRIRRRQSIWTIAAMKLHRMWKRAKIRSIKQNQMGRPMFGANNNSTREAMLRNDPFIAIPVEFNSKLIFGRGLPSRMSQHMD